ncbi:hypothetical protein HOB10_04670 [Candidatus Parcubacteria bacterium]|jgi:hypothetical protein|nr:hypothetical protein [Candidatus Parcubacteria bacterium]
MKKKIFLVIISLIIIGGGVYIWQLKSSFCVNYVLDETHAVFNRDQIPYKEDGKMKSPWDKSELELIVIDPDDPEIMDEPWRYAYYSKNDDTFWIAEMPGKFLQWFGPYTGHPCD